MWPLFVPYDNKEEHGYWGLCSWVLLTIKVQGFIYEGTIEPTQDKIQWPKVGFVPLLGAPLVKSRMEDKGNYLGSNVPLKLVTFEKKNLWSKDQWMQKMWWNTPETFSGEEKNTRRLQVCFMPWCHGRNYYTSIYLFTVL